MPTPDELVTWLDAFHGGDASAVREVRYLIGAYPGPFDRTTYHPGHVTASGVVFSPDLASVLLVLHATLGRWLQPGGHVEPQDRTIVDTAVREVFEETGVPVGRVAALAGVSVHAIPASRTEPPHRHFDLAFTLVAESEVLRPTHEAREVVWCPLPRLADYRADGALSRAVDRAARYWRDGHGASLPTSDREAPNPPAAPRLD